MHDFLIKELGRAVPYGVYDLAANAGRVSVGVDHDKAAGSGSVLERQQRADARPAVLSEVTGRWSFNLCCFAADRGKNPSRPGGATHIWAEFGVGCPSRLSPEQRV